MSFLFSSSNRKTNALQLIFPADLNSMQAISSLNITNIIRTNITSSLAVNPNYNYFAALTRELSKKNSQWIYRLDYYDFNTYKKLQSIDVYQTYNPDKHFLTFIPHLGNTSFIAVSTTNDIIFYRTDPLRKIASFLHQQSNIYDLKASPDGELTVLVGQKIVMFRNNGFKQIIFPQQIENARFCDFSRNGHYMVIASTNSLNIYTFAKSNDDYSFQQINLNAISPIAYGSITSVQFNPTDSQELLVGFLDASPMAYSVTSGVFFKRLADTQPKSSQNAKIARYMPDGQKYYSFDYLNGVGLWPGSKAINGDVATYRLYYAQNFLLYDASTNSNGTVLIGFVWQSIKVVKIIQPLLCTKNDQGCTCKETTCFCKDGYIENSSTFQCEQLACLQSQYATGKIIGNSCECNSGYIFDSLLRKCVIDCRQIKYALLNRPSVYECYCSNNWSWNAQTRRCVFDCTKIAFSTGISVRNYECACIEGFIWDENANECVCPKYMQPQGGTCVCLNYYYAEINNRCLANCSSIISTTNANALDDPTQCLCQNGYYYTIKNNIPGCQLNCRMINDTIGEGPDFTTCICREHMDWFNNSCVVNCKVISYSDPSGEVNNTCTCAINYLWIDKIKECAKNCTGVKNTIKDADSTLISCPCISNFDWNEANSRCEIQCSKIPNSQDYSLIQIDKCECRPGFNWNPDTFSCKVDCGAIWNAKGRINDSFCQCQDDQPFNNQTLTCSSAAAAGLFSSKLAIIGFAVGIVVVIVILIILVRFCWKFSTDVNKEGEKKIKMFDGSKKKGKLIKGKQKVNHRLQEDELKTNERLNTPKKTNKT